MQEYSYSYTKHIYAGTQRIASKLGDIEAFGADPRRVEYAGANLKEVDFGSKYEQQTKALLARYDSLGVEHRPNTLNDYVGGQSFCCGEKELVSNNQTGDNTFETPDYEQLIFFYHPDHLGSTALVTDNDGNVVQSVAYIPYGEVFIEERNGTWNTPYLFNGKELDEETGLYYYGARYLNPTNCMWLSVDPLFEDYKGVSPYAYCLGNPVKHVDVEGEWVWVAISAAIGGVVNASVAYAEGKSGGEIASAFVGGAVGGAVAACGGVIVGGVAKGLSMGAKTAIQAGLGALGGALGDATEQGVNIANGTQKKYNVKNTLVASGVGAISATMGSKVEDKLVDVVEKHGDKLVQAAKDVPLKSLKELQKEGRKAFRKNIQGLSKQQISANGNASGRNAYKEQMKNYESNISSAVSKQRNQVRLTKISLGTGTSVLENRTVNLIND